MRLIHVGFAHRVRNPMSEQEIGNKEERVEATPAAPAPKREVDQFETRPHYPWPVKHRSPHSQRRNLGVSQCFACVVTEPACSNTPQRPKNCRSNGYQTA